MLSRKRLAYSLIVLGMCLPVGLMLNIRWWNQFITRPIDEKYGQTIAYTVTRAIYLSNAVGAAMAITGFVLLMTGRTKAPAEPLVR